MTPFSPLQYLLDKARKARDHAGQTLAGDRRSATQTAATPMLRSARSARFSPAAHQTGNPPSLPVSARGSKLAATGRRISRNEPSTSMTQNKMR